MTNVLTYPQREVKEYGMQKTERVTLRVTEAQKERIENQAIERDMSVSSYVMWLINQDAEQIEKEKLKKAKRIKELQKV